MNLMLLTQASLFSDKGLIGLDAGTQITMSRDGNFAISYSSTALYIYKKYGSSWNRINTFDGLSNVKFVKLSGDNSKIAISYNTTGNFYPDRIQVYNFDTSTGTLSALTLITSTSNIWHFDVNALGVIYVNPGTVFKLFRYSGSTTQTISFTEMANYLAGVWFSDDTTLNFKWSGQSTGTLAYSVGTVSVTSTSAFTRTVLATSLPGSFDPEVSDFSRSTFCFAGLSSDTYDFYIVTDGGYQTISASSLGLPTGWFTRQAKVSSDGRFVAVLLYNENYLDHLLFMLSKNAAGTYFIAGTAAYPTPKGTALDVLASSSAFTSFLVETNLGPKQFIM
jgi:hypothetical protein